MSIEKKILFLTKYSYEGASSRYRSYNYEKYFQKNNFYCEYKPLLYDGYAKDLFTAQKISKLKVFKCMINRFAFLIKNAKKYTHIVVEKELFPYCPLFIERILLSMSDYSLDFDDNPKSKYTNNKIMKILFGNKIDNLSQRAKFVTVGNKWYFGDVKSDKLHYQPTVIDLDRYPLKKEYNKSEDSPVIIAWIGSPSTAFYLNIIKATMERLSSKYNIVFRVIGAKLEFESSLVNMEILDWSEKEEANQLLESDIGIMPLLDNYYAKGKCGFKLIQYMAAGLPVVASPVSANMEIITHGKNGYTASSDDEWYCYLEKLIISAELRSKMGKEGRHIVEDKYCYQKWGQKYVDLVSSDTKDSDK